ncbi:hypothetical protein TKK_0002001 [Trichogramma kaykai]|uniref:DUF1279 domain-containing protein n=1 Tax=Trichogramma kaykai TaxID=54128 RepID=A0ABD2X894_9HYME
MALMRFGSSSADLAGILAKSSYAATTVPSSCQQNNHRPLHASSVRRYPEAPRLPLPHNISEVLNTELTSFGPERSRDISAPLFLYNQDPNKFSSSFGSTNKSAFNTGSSVRMQQTDCYDCFGVVSLSSSMQTNVPKPFLAGNRSTYLNMPGGVWAREAKYLAENIRKSHFTVYQMRDANRSGAFDAIRNYSTSSSPVTSDVKNQNEKKTSPTKSENQKIWDSMSKRQKLGILVRDYGRTVMAFHIGISLVSLGSFYWVVSSGLDITPAIKFIAGESEDDLIKTVMNQSSTFLIAYAVHKLFAPVRISLTLGCTPILVRFLRKKGVLKPPKAATPT